ncbi:MAG: NGG1p interacting factor NIF3 [Patescibacteria group bacterium]|jgi:putative NIF3 family GTP cyclohydrolase 1 type 2
MNVQQIFDLAIKLGVDADLRGKAAVQKMLRRKKELYDKLGKDAKAEFDTEALTNPYLDSRVHYDSGKPVKKVLVGIDMEGDELIIANQMKDIDAVIAHHPRGKGLADLADVMHLQAEVLAGYGVPINVAEGVQREKISEVARSLSAVNHYRPVDMARLLNLSYLNIHTPADNLVASFLKKKITSGKCEYVGDIMKMLKGIPEYTAAVKLGTGPKVLTGSANNHCGKIAITEITGGTEGSPKIYEKMAQAGIGTVISMHQSEEHRKEAEAAHINVIIAGHISSDSLGMNLFLDELEKKGIKLIPCSGLIRVSRNKKNRQ